MKISSLINTSMMSSEPPNPYEYLEVSVPKPIMKPIYSDRCAYCEGIFSYYWRWRHHCRNCGASVCSSCSDMRLLENPDSRRCSRQHTLACERRRAAFVQIQLAERTGDMKN